MLIASQLVVYDRRPPFPCLLVYIGRCLGGYLCRKEAIKLNPMHLSLGINLKIAAWSSDCAVDMGRRETRELPPNESQLGDGAENRSLPC